MGTGQWKLYSLGLVRVGILYLHWLEVLRKCMVVCKRVLGFGEVASWCACFRDLMVKVVECYMIYGLVLIAWYCGGRLPTL